MESSTLQSPRRPAPVQLRLVRPRFRLVARTLVLGSLLATVISTLLVYPHELSYFNELAGGPANGASHLAHSSLDWGQGLLELERELDKHSEWGPVAIAYGGPLDPDAIGIRAMPIDWNRRGSPLDGFSHVAISASLLAGSPQANRSCVRSGVVPAEFKAFFGRQKPLVNLGGSMQLFDAAPFNQMYEGLHAGQRTESPQAPPAGLDHPGRPLVAALPQLTEVWRQRRHSIAALVHNLLLLSVCGARSEAPFPAHEAFRLLTDERLAEAALGKSPFIRTRNGLRYRLIATTSGDDSEVGESHRDQCLATFGLLQYRLDEPIRLKSADLAIRDLLTESIANFTYEQGELSFTAQAYAHYLPPINHWTDRFGRTTDFSELARYLINHEQPGQSCAGLHVVDAVAQIVEADYRTGVLDASTRRVAHQYLQEFLEAVSRNQRDDGSWDTAWNRPIGSAPPPAAVSAQLLATGHILEILHRLQPPAPPRLIARSTKWVLANVSDVKVERLPRAICPLTHCLRGAYLSFGHRFVSDELIDLFGPFVSKENDDEASGLGIRESRRGACFDSIRHTH
jgi:hypothetical protein